ncbi:MAG: membrane associated rhomboid family serine protease [Flavobacteriaceae bacterium]|jgi:membrane associated rhomboid family serine protease
MLKNLLGNIPPVTKNLLFLNVILYIVTLFLASSGTDLGVWLGGHYVTSNLFEPYQVVTHMFMHSQSGIFHILFNMMILVLIGAHLERIWGAKKYFIVYFASGLGAFILYNAIGLYELQELKNYIISSGDLANYGYGNFEDYLNDLHQLRPYYFYDAWTDPMKEYAGLNSTGMVGASGALFGLLASFAILFPNIPMNIMFIPIPIKAKYLIGAYLAYEVYKSLYPVNDGIAHSAHVGGAIVGIIIVLIWRKKGKNFN